MDENESKSPWDELAQELGVESSSEASQRSQPPPSDIPPSVSSDSTHAPQPPTHSPSDWNALANSLGIEITEPDPPVEEITEEPAEVTAQELHQGGETEDLEKGDLEESFDETLPPLPSEVDQIMGENDWGGDDLEATEKAEEEDDQEDSSPTISGEAARNAFDALFTAEGSAVAIPPFEPRTEQPSEAFFEAEDTLDRKEEELPSSSDEEESPKRRRPRRRRRGRGGQKTDTQKSQSEENSKSQTDIAEEGLDSFSDSSESEEKPRRRRSRRRSRRSDAAEDPTRNGDSQDATASDDEGLTEKSQVASRSRGHRNLPTWSEAVGVIVEANLEQRTKAPNKSNSSRGRGRGGRRRKKS